MPWGLPSPRFSPSYVPPSWASSASGEWISAVPDNLWKVVLASLYLAVLGEILHRGFIFQSLTVEIRAFPAILFSCAFFAILRFIHPLGEISRPSSSVDFLAGFKAFPGLFDQVTDFNNILPAFIGYFLLGALYCLAYLKTDSLYVSIGAVALFSFTELSRIVEIKSRLFVGRKIILGSSGPVPDAFMGGMMAWIALLVAIIAFLSVNSLASGKDRKNG